MQLSSTNEISNIKKQFNYTTELNEYEKNKIKNYFRRHSATFEKIVQEKLTKNAQLYKITKNKNRMGASKVSNGSLTQVINTVTPATHIDPYLEVKNHLYYNYES